MAGELKRLFGFLDNRGRRLGWRGEISFIRRISTNEDEKAGSDLLPGQSQRGYIDEVSITKRSRQSIFGEIT